MQAVQQFVLFIFRYCRREKIFLIFFLLGLILLMSAQLVFQRDFQVSYEKLSKDFSSWTQVAVQTSIFLSVLLVIFIVSVGFNALSSDFISPRYRVLFLTKPVGFRQYGFSLFGGMLAVTLFFVLTWSCFIESIVVLNTHQFFTGIFTGYFFVGIIAVLVVSCFFFFYSVWNNAFASFLTIQISAVGLFLFEIERVLPENLFLGVAVRFSSFFIPPLDAWLRSAFSGKLLFPSFTICLRSFLLVFFCLFFGVRNLKRRISRSQ